MATDPTIPDGDQAKARVRCWGILLLGLLLPQIALYWPSLIGTKILLPLDILEMPQMYIPRDSSDPLPTIHNPILSDGVLQTELNRRFSAEEIRAGRLPLWNPYNYCGTPFLAANNTAVLSPFRILDYLWPSPVAVAWGHLLQVLVGGIGAFLFFERAWKVRFLAAAIGAWCYPLNGFVTLWSYQTISAVVVWLPWVLWMTDAAVRKHRGLAGIGLAIITAALLFSGHAETGAQVLLVSGIYFLWCMIDEFGWRGAFSRREVQSACVVVAGWTLGSLLSAPQNLPTLDYLQDSYRIGERTKGFVESPPQGITSLVQMIFPYFYGTNDFGSIYIDHGNLQESAAIGYTGLLVTLFLAPLAIGHRRLRSAFIFCLIAGVLGSSYLLDIPGLSRLFQLPPLHLLRNNRFVFVTGWAILSAGVIGADALLRNEIRWRREFWLIIAVLAVLGGVCLDRSYSPPEKVAIVHQTIVRETNYAAIADLSAVQRWFSNQYLYDAGLCAVAAICWLLLARNILTVHRWVWIVGVLTLCELTWNASSILPQVDPKLYYPKIPVIAELERLPAGRVCGVTCFPPCLNLSHRIADIRGYDGVDPRRIVELYNLYRFERYSDSPSYAVIQYFVPQPESPLADLLNLRYFIYRGKPPDSITPLRTFQDYWISENPLCLPRAFVPERAEIVNDKARRLQLLARPAFDPRHVAYMESAPDLPPPPYRGKAEILSETPLWVRLRVEMKTAGVLILSDSWNRGWKASLNGNSLPIAPANHAFRGVILPAGNGIVEFRYEPASFTWGLILCGIAIVICAGWTAIVWRTRNATSAKPQNAQ